MNFKDARGYKTELGYGRKLMCLVDFFFINVKLYKFILGMRKQQG